ncbi:hypothetical protein ACPV5U_19235 [Vibrio mediterranei]
MARDEYYQFVIDEVIDHGNNSVNDSCPCCGKRATRRDFEAVHSGSVNQHYTLDCSHCGHHECDQEDGMCFICDTHSSVPSGYKESGRLDLLVTKLREDMIVNCRINPLDWSFAKLYALQNPDAVDWYDTVYGDNHGLSVKGFIRHTQQCLLDIKFETWLDNKIDAENSLEVCPRCSQKSLEVTVHSSDVESDVYVCFESRQCTNCGHYI